MSNYIVQLRAEVAQPDGSYNKMSLKDIMHDCYNEDEAVTKAINIASDTYGSLIRGDILVDFVTEYNDRKWR